MKKGDKIIWNSGFGYELGYYVQLKGIMYHTEMVYLKTGRYIQGKFSVACSEILEFTVKNLEQMTKEYGYKIEWNNEWTKPTDKDLK